MSIQSEIERIENNVANTYSTLEELGADIPAQQNTNNLQSTVSTIKAVRYDSQTLTETQKTQARTNIGAASTSEVNQLSQEVSNLAEEAESKVSAHNTSDVSHSDIRLLIEGLTTRLNTLANSDDTTLDQMAEVVAYIKNNKSLIDAITTGKVSVSDIVDNLTTNVSNKPLSAKQGVQLKALIDDIVVPTLLSELGEDSTHRLVTDVEKETWNAKSNFSGKYADLTGKPTIPSKTSQLTNDSGFAKQADVTELLGQIDDQNILITSKANKGYVDEEIVKAKVQMSKGNPMFVNSVEECTDTKELYLLPDGYIYAYMTKEVTNENTVVVKGKVARLENMRYSNSSASFKSVSGYHTLVIPIVSDGTSDVIELAFTNATWTSMYDNLLYGETNTLFTGTATKVNVVTDQPTITVKGIPTGKWFIEVLVKSSNFSGIGVAVDGESLEVVTSTTGTEATLPSSTTTSETIRTEGFFTTGIEYGSSKNGTEVITSEGDISSYIGTIQAPSPQLPADGSNTSDLNLNTCTSNELHAYLDDVVARYPNYIVRELLGKDESGTLDIYRYTMSKHSYYAWQKANYPKMYGWVNGSTVIYSVSVSPRIGDTMYSTRYVGTSYGTISAVSSANRTRTVNGTVFTRSESNDVSPTLVYSQNIVTGTSLRNSSLATVDSISAINGNTVTSANGDTYYRYPFGDLDKDTRKRIPMTIIANEHGGSGEPRDCALIVARFIRDLCENKHQDNPIFKYIRENVNLTVIPCVNPYGWNMYNSANGYRNANGVNINRNYDTKGWDVYLAENSDEADTMGAYAGSENETQYVMNTMSEIGSKIAMSVHGIDKARENLVVYYQGQNPNGAYSEEKISEIYEDYLSRYGLRFVAYNPLECPPESTSKSPSYITQIGAYGGLIEFNNNDSQIKEGEANRRYTSWTMEQQYTLLLKFLAMWISDYEESI